MVDAHLLRRDSEAPRASDCQKGLEGIPVKFPHGDFCTVRLWNCPFYCKKLAAIVASCPSPMKARVSTPARRNAIQPYEKRRQHVAYREARNPCSGLASRQSRTNRRREGWFDVSYAGAPHAGH